MLRQHCKEGKKVIGTWQKNELSLSGSPRGLIYLSTEPRNLLI